MSPKWCLKRRDRIEASLQPLQHAMPIASDARKNGSGASSGIAAQLIKNYSCTKETRTVENWPVKAGYFVCCGPQDLDSSSAQTFTHCSTVKWCLVFLLWDPVFLWLHSTLWRALLSSETGPAWVQLTLYMILHVDVRNRTGLGTIDALLSSETGPAWVQLTLYMILHVDVSCQMRAIRSTT